MTLQPLLPACAAFLSLFAGIVRGADFSATLKPFLETHCIECHDADTHKGGLRLDNLGFDLQSEPGAGTWTRVLDKAAGGEMPPKKKPRPSPEELGAVTKFLHAELHAASLAHQQKRGRVVVRRLNGTEYENTVRELVGTQVSLKDLLPEDGSVAGFDNVSSALDVSGTHLLLYQEAAEKAVMSAVPVCPPQHISETLNGREISEKGPNFKGTLTRTCKLEGDSLIAYSRLPRYGLIRTQSVTWGGRYHIQFKASAVGGGGKAIPVGYLNFIQNGPEEPVLKDVHEIAPGEPQIYELDYDLGRREPFIINLLTVTNPTAKSKTLDGYDGLGLRVDWLKIEGPVGEFPPASYNKLFEGVPLKPRSVANALAAGRKPPEIKEPRSEYQWLGDPLVPFSEHPKEDAERLIRSFVQRAFRRPVGEEQQKEYVQAVQAKLDGGGSFYEAMLYGYKYILSSADFLFLFDPTPADTRGDLPTSKLDDFALAERLAYFLTSHPPDDELRALAAKGALSTPAELRVQTERLLSSAGARQFTKNFTGQWLDLRQMEATIPDPVLFGDFDYLLQWSMQQETELFFDEVLKHDLPLTDFTHSDWSMLNERLAKLYGIPGVEGNAFRKVKLPPEAHRGGVMTQASILKVTADGTRTSPVLRGKWVLERILGRPPQPPPPDVPAIDPDIRGATTIRQQLDKHRSIASCAGCHSQIDPPGFALETFDPIGNWRDFYRVTLKPTPRSMPVLVHASNNKPIYQGPEVEKGYTMPDGREFKDIDGYKALLLADKDQLARNLVEKIIVYATGADIQFADREVVEEIVARLRTRHFGFRTLIHEVVQSRVFLNK